MVSIITPVVNHFNTADLLLKIIIFLISVENSCAILIFLWKPRFVFSPFLSTSSEKFKINEHLFEIDNNIKVFTITFDQFSAPLQI